MFAHGLAYSFMHLVLGDDDYRAERRGADLIEQPLMYKFSRSRERALAAGQYAATSFAANWRCHPRTRSQQPLPHCHCRRRALHVDRLFGGSATERFQLSAVFPRFSFMI